MIYIWYIFNFGYCLRQSPRLFYVSFIFLKECFKENYIHFEMKKKIIVKNCQSLFRFKKSFD